MQHCKILRTFIRTGWLLGLVTIAFGQTAQVSGRITDATGAVVPGAQVTLTNLGNGLKREAETNDEGTYFIPLLPLGNYEIAVRKTGFKPTIRSGLTLNVNQSAGVDFTLETGTVTETVKITEAAPVVETQSSGIGQLIDRNMIEGMPLPNRAATALVVLTPGAAVVAQGGGGENIPIFSVGGGRVRNQNYTLDGGNVTNVVGLAVPQQQTSLPMDAMQEFRVITNNYAAEHGHSTGGVVILTTKAGTNEFHGSVFEYLRNDALDARNFFAAAKPRLRLNQFGGSFGGPIKKDRTHFFASWEETRQITGGTATLTVPTERQRNGDFSETRNAAGGVIPIYDPATTTGNTRQPFAGNVILPNRIDPVAKAIAAYWPMPNRPGTATGANNFQVNTRPEFRRDIVVSRFDHQFRASDQLMVRHYINDNSSTTPAFYSRPEADPNALVQQGRTQSILGSWTHTFSPRTINEFRYGYVRRKNVQLQPELGKNLASQLGLKGVSEQAFPIIGVTGFAGLGRDPFRRQTPIEDTQVQNAVTHNRGQHSLKAGVEYRRGFNRDDTDTSSSGNFSFTPLITGLPGNAATGNALASFLLGEVNSASLVRPDVIISHAAYWAGYAQDDWRVNERLTLNLGLRWEVEIPRTVDNDRMNAFDTKALNPVCNCPGVITFAGRNGVPRSAYDADFNNFGPRFGFAYRLPRLGTTVVRGGAGYVYGPTVSGIVATAAALGFSTQVNLSATQPGFNSALRLRDGFPTISRTPVDQLGAGFGAVPAGRAPTTAVAFFERNRPTPTSIQYNLNVQHELRQNLLVEVGYLANLSHHLTANDLTINQVPTHLLAAGNLQSRRPFPQFTNVSVINPPVGNSTYHAIFIKGERRYANGFSLLAHYTFSKFIDDVASFSEYGDPGSYMDAYRRFLDKGLSGSDIPHRALVSAVYALPFFKDQGWVTTLLGGWKAGVIATFQSGPPFTVTTATNTTNAFPAGGLRPDLIGEPKRGGGTIARWFNTDAFRQPAQFTFGTSPRSGLRGPGYNNVDFSLLKDFKLTERWKTEFRGEFFNLLNHANFGLPGRTFGTPAFGVISSAREARSIQLALRIAF